MPVQNYEEPWNLLLKQKEIESKLKEVRGNPSIDSTGSTCSTSSGEVFSPEKQDNIQDPNPEVTAERPDVVSRQDRHQHSGRHRKSYKMATEDQCLSCERDMVDIVIDDVADEPKPPIQPQTPVQLLSKVHWQDIIQFIYHANILNCVIFTHNPSLKPLQYLFHSLTA